MKADVFGAGQRSREYFHGLRVLPGAWTVIRVDGHGFSRLTRENYEKPFDGRLWVGAGSEDVVDYFSWRQSDATRGVIGQRATFG